MAKKFYWLRLKDDWFTSKAIKKLRKLAGGDTYTIIYLKMQLLSLKNEGRLFYDNIEETFAEELALELDEEVDNVSVTISFLQKCGLLEIADDNGIVLTEVPAAIGCESESAERVRKHRALQKNLSENLLQCNASVTECNTEIEKEREKNKETEEKESKNLSSEQAAEQNTAPEPEPIITLPLNTGDEFPFYQKDLDEFSALYPAVDVLQAMRGMRGWCMTNPSKRKTKQGIRRFVNSWLSREQDKGENRGYSGQQQGNIPGYAERARRWAET